MMSVHVYGTHKVKVMNIEVKTVYFERNSGLSTVHKTRVHCRSATQESNLRVSRRHLTQGRAFVCGVYFVGNVMQPNNCNDDKYIKVKVVPVYAIKAYGRLRYSSSHS